MTPAPNDAILLIGRFLIQCTIFLMLNFYQKNPKSLAGNKFCYLNGFFTGLFMWCLFNTVQNLPMAVTISIMFLSPVSFKICQNSESVE